MLRTAATLIVFLAGCANTGIVAVRPPAYQSPEVLAPLAPDDAARRISEACSARGFVVSQPAALVVECRKAARGRDASFVHLTLSRDGAAEQTWRFSLTDAGGATRAQASQWISAGDRRENAADDRHVREMQALLNEALTSG